MHYCLITNYIDLTNVSLYDIFGLQSLNTHAYYNSFLYIITSNYLILYYLYISQNINKFRLFYILIILQILSNTHKNICKLYIYSSLHTFVTGRVLQMYMSPRIQFCSDIL